MKKLKVRCQKIFAAYVGGSDQVSVWPCGHYRIKTMLNNEPGPNKGKPAKPSQVEWHMNQMLSRNCGSSAGPCPQCGIRSWPKGIGFIRPTYILLADAVFKKVGASTPKKWNDEWVADAREYMKRKTASDVMNQEGA